jgi:hypothetical protein
LTYIFECIDNHPELQSIFEDDLEDLFGIRHNYDYDLKNYPLLLMTIPPKAKKSENIFRISK